MDAAQPAAKAAAAPLRADPAAFDCDAVSIAFSKGRLDRDLHPVLAGVSLSVRSSEFLTIVGGSGVGKTTLLRAMAGLIKPVSGEITVRGKAVDGPPEDVLLVFQDYSNSLLPWRKVEDNVALGLEAQDVPKAERKQRIAEALRMVGLDGARGKFPWQLSGGMQQRLQLARALALKPSSLLMDEPFGSLDAITKATLQDELQRVHATTGTTIVFITHDVEEAVYLGDRAIVLAGSPAGIVEELEIDLPRPRDQLSTREMPRFLELRHSLHKAIQENGRRSSDGGNSP
jgi:NitT/TauT family transport system ATP-binding protein